jgi:hypothetical protein
MPGDREGARPGGPLFAAGPYRAFELGARDVPRLQRFYDANPEYHLLVKGEPPGVAEAQKDFDDRPPAGWPYEKRWLIGFVDEGDAMVAVADVVSNLLAEGVWHVGLFIVATSLHGSGAAQAIYAGLESWMRAAGARWVRLGVVDCNERGARFWHRCGYREVRQRHGVPTETREHTVHVLVKPLANGPLAEYLEIVPRDRPEAP